MTTLKTMAVDLLTAMIPFVSFMGEGLQGLPAPPKHLQRASPV